MRTIDDQDLRFHRSYVNKLFIIMVFAVRKKILNYENGTHNFVHTIEVRGTRANRAHEASFYKN